MYSELTVNQTDTVSSVGSLEHWWPDPSMGHHMSQENRNAYFNNSKSKLNINIFTFKYLHLIYQFIHTHK